MKELSIKEKAKRYDEALGKAKKELDTCGSQDCDAARQIFRFFPELVEGDDERIRTNLIDYFSNCKALHFSEQEIVAWLEKQGEQNPTWSEEDEGMWIFTIKILNKILYKDNANWLKSLKERIQPQPMK